MFDRGDDVGICPAPAQISAHALADFLVGQFHWNDDLAHVWRHVAGEARVCFLEETHRRQDLPRRAKAALKRIALEECLLDRVEATILRQAFDGEDLPAAACRRERQARQHPLSIENHRARAAGALVTPLLGAWQLESISQSI